MFSLEFSNIDFDNFKSEIKEMIDMISDNTETYVGSEINLSFKRGKKEFKITLGKLLMFSIISFPRSYLKEIDEEDFEEFLSLSNLNKDKMIGNFHNNTFKLLYSSKLDIGTFKKYLSSSIDMLADAAYAVNEAFGNTTNVIDMLRLKHSNQKVADVINMTLNERSDYSEVVKTIKDANSVLMEEIKKANNSFSYILSSISPGQFQQVFCAVGYKPEVISSNIFPHCVNTNLLKGYRNEMDYFVSALGARKAAITNAIQVSTGGYLSRKMILLVSGQVENDKEDCGTNELVPVKLFSNDIAVRFRNRYASTSPNGELFEVNENNYKEFVGEKLYFRGPATCKVKSGVCKKCIGTSSIFNPFHSAIASITKLTEQMIQRLLSSKHLLQINPKKIIIPEVLKDFLFVDKTSLVSFRGFKLELNHIEENSDDKKICTKFTIITDEGEKVFFEATEEMEFLLEPILDQINFKSKKVPVINVFEDSEVFSVDVENDELVTPLKKIIKVLESEKTLNEKSLEGNLEYFLHQLSVSGLDSTSLAIELILRELIRNPDNIQERPETFKDNNYTFLRLTNALVNHPSLAVSLAFERLSTVIEENVFGKGSPSLIDGLF